MAKFLYFFIFILSYCKSELSDNKQVLNIHTPNSIKINKVSLTQKGYIQFLRYLTDVPPVEDFTFCIWLKSSNLTYTHPLLSYSRHESDRFIRAWVAPHGESINLAVREKEIFSVPVELKEHEWYHICPSWSSGTGYWDLYLDGKLKSHGYSEKARGIILPKNGDIVVGQEYTDFDKGLDDGIEGDIFGFNMVLSSTKPKEKIISKYTPRFNSRRRSPIDRHDKGFLVQSPTLLIRRRTRKSHEGNLGDNLNINDHNNNSTHFNSATERDDLISTKIHIDSEESPSTVTTPITLKRKKRQSFGTFGPVSYSNFNFDYKPPIYKHFEPVYRSYIPKIPTYAYRHQYVPDQFMSPPAPPRKTSRVSNDIIPLGSVSHKTLGLQLIELSFNCALGKGAPLKNVLISWTKTPVRVFGGAILKQADPFCYKTEL